MNKQLIRFPLFLLMYLTLPLTATAQVVDIPDPNLRAAIEKALGKAPGTTITATEMATLTRLEARNANISDLTGLEFATNLKSLWLDGEEVAAGTWRNSNSVSDLSPLAGLTNLTELLLDDNNITDISPLSGLTNLTNLGLSINNITNILPLVDLTNLEVLGLWRNSVSDLSPLAGLTNLIELYLGANPASDLSPLAGLTNLESLFLDEHGISNLSALAGLTNLTRLALNNNLISDLSPLAGLTNLRWMRLAGNNISDLSPLVVNTGLGNGDTVDVRSNPLNYTSINTHISTLQSRGVTVEFDNRTPTTLLNISGVITELDNLLIVEVRDGNGLPFAGVPVTFTITSGGGTLSTTPTTTDENGRAESRFTLDSVEDTNTVRASVEGISKSVTFSNVAADIPDPNLRAAVEKALGKASGATITTADMATLTRLDANEAGISDLTGLEQATNLRDLHLRSNSVSDLSPLTGLTSLTWMRLGGNSISDISPVKGLTNLKVLSLWANSISDISPTASLTNLIELNLSSNSISDISPVAGLPNLTWLHLPSNSISDISPVAGLMNLTALRLDRNSISDISALLGLTQLTELRLDRNNITDLSPLVANIGLGSGDAINVKGNPLNYTSIQTHIPTLQGRGVTVKFDDTTNLNVDEPRAVEFDNTKNLNVGEPRTVRMIYFLPNDRPYRADVVQKMKDEIRTVQNFFADQMGAHGYGNKTFRLETDSQGALLVHRVDGQYPDSHYLYRTEDTVFAEIERKFDVMQNIYSIVIDNSINEIRWGEGRRAIGFGGRRGKNGGLVLHSGEFGWQTLAHHMGHGFGLWHDFSDGAYIMSYGPGWNRLSPYYTEYLSVHPYFNPEIPLEAGQTSTMEFISPRTYPAGSENVSIRLKVSDSEGLYQVLLLLRTGLGHPGAGSIEVKAGRGFMGEKDAIVEFDYDGVTPSDKFTSLSNPAAHRIHVQTVDTAGNVSQEYFVLAEISPYHIASLEGHTGAVHSMSFSSDGKTLASGAYDNMVKLWNVELGTNIAIFPGGRSMSFSSDGTTLASAWKDTVKLWDVTTQQVIATLSHTSFVHSVSFSSSS